MIRNFIILLFFCCLSNQVIAEVDIDQWEDSSKTYRDLINEGFEVRAYDTSVLKTEGGLTIMFFVTVLQKEKEVYECQEYQTFDQTMQTLDMTFICRRIVQPYKNSVGI